MKIEKISDTQIRVTLNHTDLLNRDIKISELAYGSQKAQALFKDMMNKAFEDFGFVTDNVPLMIEAVPLSTDSIMLVVTKVEDPTQIDEKLDKIGERPTHRTFKDPIEDRLTDLELMGSSDDAKTRKPITCFMYSFSMFDDVCAAAHHIKHLYFGDNSLYKYDSRYFLVLNKNEKASVDPDVIPRLLCEFGTPGNPTELNEVFLKEHGKILIPANAIDVLSKYL